MFGRQFRQAEHRQHLPNPNTPGYTFELIGASPRTAAGPRKQASSLTWGHETAEQSMLGEDVWFAYSGDGFNASVSEESPGSGRFTADIYTDSDLYKYLSTTEYGFESVDEAKSFVEGVFGYSRVSSRTAGKCPKCDGMGRETYETDTGSLSTQTCTACGGTGVTASRRTANDWEAIQDKVQLSGWDPMYADYIAWALDNDKNVTDTYSIVDYSDLMGLDAEDEKLIKKFVNVTAPRLYSNRRTAFLDTVHFAEPRHRVAGWDWDDHLNGFIAAEAAREFTCACGDNIPAPGYTDCRCGKRWNAYTIQANGSQKMIAREVPVRKNVVMARTARLKTASPATMSDADLDLEYQKIRRQVNKGDSTNFDRGLELRRELKSRGLPTNLKPPHIMRQEYGDKYDTFVSRKQAAELGDISDKELLEIFNTATDNENFDVMMTALQELQSRGLGDQAVNRGASRKQADADTDARWFFQNLKGKGYTLPKDAGYPGDGGQFDEYLDAFARRDGLDAEGLRSFLSDNWDEYSVGHPKDVARERALGASRKSRVMARTASRRKIAAPSSGADAIAQHFPGWRVDDDNGNFWEIHSPGGEHAFIHEENGTYTLLMDDNTPDEFYATGLSFEDALAEVRAEGII